MTSDAGALLARAGCAWYAAMLSEAGLGEAELAEALSGGQESLAAALAEAGVTDPRHVAAIAAQAEQLRAPAGACGAPSPAFSFGGAYSPSFLSAVAPLYSQHMGCENMGPLLYTLTRFCKPGSCLELGGGYTSLFLLQALADNAAEIARAEEAAQHFTATAAVPWLAPEVDAGKCATAQLHVVDTCVHSHSTAGGVASIAASLALSPHLAFHAADAFHPDLPSTLQGPRLFDLIWLDVGAGTRLAELVQGWWPRLDPRGGIMAVHSTLTNQAGRSWLRAVQRAQAQAVLVECADEIDSEAAAALPLGFFEVISLLEPHKRFQNSVTLLRRRGGGAGGVALFKEPIYSKLP